VRETAATTCRNPEHGAASAASFLEMRARSAPLSPAFVGMALVVLGASLPSSPSRQKLPGSWIFASPPPDRRHHDTSLLGIAVVYGGMLVCCARGTAS